MDKPQRPPPALNKYAAIPGLGRVKWCAFSLALQGLVQSLEEDGEFKRLGNMSQLGALTKAEDLGFSARHTRLDYLFLCLYLIELVEGRGGQGRLQSKVTVGGQEITKGELAKAWTLLGAYGHLFDSYLAERFLFQKLRRDTLLQAQFAEDFSDVISSAFSDTVRRGDWWRLHRFVCSWRLLRTSWPEATQEFAIDALRKLIEAEGEPRSYGKVNETLGVVKVIREVSYLYLDLQFTARSVFLDPIALALQLHEEPDLFVRLLDRYDPRGSVLDSIAAYLCETVYLSPNVSPYLYEGLSHMEKWFKKPSSGELNNQVDKLIEQSVLPEASNGNRYAFSLPYPPEVWNDLEAYEEFRKVAGKRYRVYAARWPSGARFAECFFLNPNSHESPVSPAKIYKVLAKCREAWQQVGKDEFWRSVAHRGQKDYVPVSRILRSLPEFILRSWLGNSEVEFQSKVVEAYRFVCLPWLLCFGLGEARHAIDDFASRVEEEGIEPVYRESKTIPEAFEKTRAAKGFYLLCQGPLFMRYQAVEQEFDAVWLRVSSTEVRIFLLEAKQGKDKGRKAVNQLREKLKRLSPSDPPKVEDAYVATNVGVVRGALT